MEIFPKQMWKLKKMKPPPRKIQMSPEKGPFQTETSLPSLACFILSNVWGHFWNPRISATSKEIASGTWESSNTYWDIMLYISETVGLEVLGSPA